MRGDFTRDSFDPNRHFSRVLMQQGRVQLDADWNEQASIMLHLLRTMACDIFGPHGGPDSPHLGFEVLTKEVKSWEPRLDALVKGPEHDVFHDKLEEGDALICAGRYYVHGILVENERPILYSMQPGYVGFDASVKIPRLNDAPGPVLLYLDVWERQVTYLEDDRIREVALSGPDTCTRAQVAWQVRFKEQVDGGPPLDCDAVKDFPVLGTGKLKARARADRQKESLCVTRPEALYRGPENQLYRLEVQRGGTPHAKSPPTFKWSRDNGSVTLPIRSFAGDSATLETLGRDPHLSVAPGDWVELVDDDVVFGAREGAGPLAQVQAVKRSERVVTLTWPKGEPPRAAYGEQEAAAKHAFLRRWDQRGDAAQGGALEILTEKWLSLEDGVEVWFGKDGTYRAGDYWLIPARTATGDVEWPPEVGPGGKPLGSPAHPDPALLPPHGARHHYAPLCLLKTGKKGAAAPDCRNHVHLGGGAAPGPQP